MAGFNKIGQSNAGVVTAPQAGGGPHIKIFDNQALIVKEFFAYDGAFNLGTRISVGVRNNNVYPEIAVMPATGGGPHLKTFKLDGTPVVSDIAGFEPWWRGGYDAAIGQSGVWLSSGGGRRASVRQYTR